MTPGRLPFVFIVATVALDAMGIGLILPVMPDLIVAVADVGIADAALWGGLLTFAYAAMQFLFGPLLGNVSDRFGRRPVLVLSLVAMGVNYVLMALAPTLGLLFAARLLSGIAASTHPTATAYLADLSARGARSANFGLVGAAFGIGFVAGPALGGLLGEFGPRAPFWAAAALSFGTALFGLLALPESLPPARRRPFRLARANPLAAILRVRRLPHMGGLLAAEFVYKVSNYVYPAVWTYYVIARFGWSPGTVGLSLAAFGLLSGLVQGWLIRRILARLGDRGTARFGLWAHVAGLLAAAFVPTPALVFVLMPLISLGVVAGPALQGMMADRADDADQGELQGVLAASTAVAVIVSPLLMTGAFRAFADLQGPTFAGAPFALAAMLALVAIRLMHTADRGPA